MRHPGCSDAGAGEVPEPLVRRVVNVCGTNRSESYESDVLLNNVVTRNLVNGSSLLSEEAERGSFRLHALIRDYVRSDANAAARRACQDIALRAVHGTIVEEQDERRSLVVSSEQTRIRRILAIAGNAVAVLRDQVDGKTVTEAEEDKFMEVTEPLTDLTVDALRWSGRDVEAETLCTSALEFLCGAETERGMPAGSRRLMGILKAGRRADFRRRKVVRQIASKYLLQRCRARIGRGKFVEAETDARRVVNNSKSFGLPRTAGGNGIMWRMSCAAGLLRPCFHGMKSVDDAELAGSLHQLGNALQKKGDFDEAETHFRASLCMKRRIHGEDTDHPDIAGSLHGLGIVLQKKGD